ncbi:MAG: recombinase family protein [Hyphomicrobiaceae bacterium]
MKLAYIRVSTTGQNLEAQREAVLKAGAERIFEDKASGKDRNRPALKDLLAFAREGDEIVVARLDRFARSSADLHAMLADLQSRKVKVTFLDNPSMNLDTAHGELLISILAATAAFERRLILTRTEEGRATAKAKGVKFGRPSVISKELAEDVKRLKDAGELSATQIAEKLGVSRRTVYRALEG